MMLLQISCWHCKLNKAQTQKRSKYFPGAVFSINILKLQTSVPPNRASSYKHEGICLQISNSYRRNKINFYPITLKTKGTVTITEVHHYITSYRHYHNTDHVNILTIRTSVVFSAIIHQKCLPKLLVQLSIQHVSLPLREMFLVYLSVYSSPLVICIPVTLMYE